MQNVTLFTLLLCLCLTSVTLGQINRKPLIWVPFQTNGQKLVVRGQAHARGQVPLNKTKPISGVIGRGIAFKGVKNQAVTVSGSKLFDLRKALTISVWVKPFTLATHQTIISRNWNWRLRIRGGRYFAVTFLGHPYRQHRRRLKSGPIVHPGKWYHVCYTFSLSQKTCAFYVNGKKVDQARVDFKLRDEGKAPLLIGMDPANYNPYRGAVDDLKIFNRALSPTQITQLYREGQKLFTQSALHWQRQLKENNKLVQHSSNAPLQTAFETARQGVKLLIHSPGSLQYEKTQKEMTAFRSALYDYKLASKTGAQGVSQTACFVVRPFSHRPILPQSQIDLSKLSAQINLQGAPGQTLTGSFVLTPGKQAANQLTITPTALQSSKTGAIIPETAIDLRAVCTWFQATTAWGSPAFDPKKVSQPVLVPELLLHDPSLIKVDYKHKRNYLKLVTSNGYRYVDISSRKLKSYPGQIASSHQARVAIPASGFPVVDDAKHLQPVHIQMGRNQQFWLNIHLPENIPPGDYQGQLQVASASGAKGSIALNVRVLPIQLKAPVTKYASDQQFVYSVYYRGRISKNGKPYIGSDYKSLIQYKAEMEDMRDHGMDFVPNRVSLKDEKSLNQAMAIQRHILGGTVLYFAGISRNLGIGLQTNRKAFKKLTDRAQKLKAAARRHGYTRIYTYGIDELDSDKVVKEKKIWKRLGQLGIGVYVAGKHAVAQRAGDVLDVLIASGSLWEKPVKIMHAHGHRILSYANPQAGPENPKLYRVNYGIKLWKHNYDGAMTYAYQSAFGTVWNDFDSQVKPYRDENFTYPTTHGVIDTIAWEGYAQARRDVKYASKLWQLIQQYQNSTNDTKHKVAQKAKNYIVHLKINLSTNLKQVRHQMIMYILQLSQKND